MKIAVNSCCFIIRLLNILLKGDDNLRFKKSAIPFAQMTKKIIVRAAGEIVGSLDNKAKSTGLGKKQRCQLNE